ncbi:MAG: ABC transporter permease [Treponemataceae bacterium]|nr:MAG: ABC transporter permease [Treponemataceae bacterium]
MRVSATRSLIPFLVPALYCAVAVMSIFWTPQDPFAMDVQLKLAKPSSAHWFGCDNFGRDVFSRTLIAVRYSMLFAALTLILSLGVGVSIGLKSAYSHYLIDTFIMRIVDSLNAMPAILFALVLSICVPKTSSFLANFALIASLAIIFIPPFIRVSRNETLKIKELEYIQKAQMLGLSANKIVFSHILPNIKIPIASTSLIVCTNSIIVESTLSYLGLGIQPPIPSLGRLIFDSQNYLLNAPHLALFPGIVMLVLIASFHWIKIK